MNPRIKKLIADLKAVKKQLAKDRDKLREIINEAEDLLDNDALLDIENVIEDLSKYV